jgi:hypothetical protein
MKPCFPPSLHPSRSGQVQHPRADRPPPRRAAHMKRPAQETGERALTLVDYLWGLLTWIFDRLSPLPLVISLQCAALLRVAASVGIYLLGKACSVKRAVWRLPRRSGGIMAPLQNWTRSSDMWYFGRASCQLFVYVTERPRWSSPGYGPTMLRPIMSAWRGMSCCATIKTMLVATIRPH